MLSLCKSDLADSIRIKQALLAGDEFPKMDLLVRQVILTLKDRGKLFFAGNGGSFSDAIHLAAEFVSRFQMDRAPLAAIALGANNATLTAIGNDYTYADVLVRELEALSRPGDMLIALSTSGNSENVLRCVQYALDHGMAVFGLTGQSGGQMAGLCECIRVPSTATARIQECHITMGHIMCGLVEQALFAKDPIKQEVYE